MNDSATYMPPKVWTWSKPSGGAFANINRPIAGPTHEKELSIGRHPMQLYSLGTPNGVKVTIMLEELLALGHVGAEYDAWLINIGQGDQFGSGFVAINPNSKIPALLDRSGPKPIQVFESGSILLYLAEKFGAFLSKDGPTSSATRTRLPTFQPGDGSTGPCACERAPTIRSLRSLISSGFRDRRRAPGGRASPGGRQGSPL